MLKYKALILNPRRPLNARYFVVVEWELPYPK